MSEAVQANEAPPPGFPGGERAPVDAEAERLARAFAHFDDDAPAPETEPPTPEPPPPAEPPAPAEAPPAADPAPQAADLAAALAKVEELRAQLEERGSAYAEREKSIEARAEQIAKFEAFAKKAEREDFLGALSALGWDQDKVVRAITHGHGVKSPTDELRSEFQAQIDELKAAQQRELEALERTRKERDEIETRSIITRELSTADDRAPLLAVFGENGQNAVMQRLAAADPRVPRDQAIRTAIDEVEAELSEQILKPALSNPGVRKRYAEILGTRDPAAPVTSGRPLSQRDTSQVTRRAEQGPLTEEERMANALRHLE